MCIFAHYCVNRKKKTDWKEGGKRKKKKKKRNPRILARCLSRVILRKRSIDRSIHDDVGGKVSVVFFLFFFFFLINVSAWSGERMGGHIRWIHRSSKSPTRYFLDSSSIYTRVRGNSFESTIKVDHLHRRVNHLIPCARFLQRRGRKTATTAAANGQLTNRLWNGANEWEKLTVHWSANSRGSFLLGLILIMRPSFDNWK